MLNMKRVNQIQEMLKFYPQYEYKKGDNMSEEFRVPLRLPVS